MSYSATRFPVLFRTASIAALAVVSFSLVPSRGRADELKLKDGTKINGTIVGFEDNSFKVKTSYGFAVVQKDQVVSINVSNPSKTAPNSLGKAPVPGRPAKTEPAKEPAAAPSNPAVAGRRAGANPASIANAQNSPLPASAIVRPPVAAPASPPKPAPVERMREEVSGNTYTNLTYGFRMYKPPGWQLIEGARATLPGTITALGTEDQTTYLLIGQNLAGKSLAADMDETDRRLRDILENYRPLGDIRITVAGAPAVERRFRGSVDDHDWSGVVVFVPRAAHLYTIFGMTIADSDLVQIQENVIVRTISSLQFTK